MRILLIVLSLSFLTSCSGNKGIPDIKSLTNNINPEDLANLNDNLDSSLDEGVEQPVTSGEEDTVVFDETTGECSQVVSSNELKDCASFTDQVVEGLDFSQGSYQGANFEGAVVTNSILDYYSMAEQEIIVDENTSFDDPNAFTNLNEQQEQIIANEEDKIQDYQTLISLEEQMIDELTLEMQNTSSEEEAANINEEIQVIEESVEYYEYLVSVASQKVGRYTQQEKITEELLKLEPVKESFKVNNKNWVELGDARKVNLQSSLELMPSIDTFTFSFWFRTAFQSNHFELSKLPLGENVKLELVIVEDGIEANLVHQAQIVETKKMPLNYFTNKWHHLMVRYDGLGFVFYLDGEARDLIAYENVELTEDVITLGSGNYDFNYFSMDIDEVALWNLDLNADAIKNIFNNGIPTKLHNNDSSDFLVKWWRMGDQAPKKVMGNYQIEEAK